MHDFLKENIKIKYKRKEILAVLMELDYILCSLHYMGSFYCDKDRDQYEKETTRFIDDNLICNRLASIRYVLSVSFDEGLSENDADNLEKVFETIPYWKKPGDLCDKFWIKDPYNNREDDI